VRNSTVEEYARYLMERLLEDSALIGERDIREVGIKVSSGPGQWGTSHWRRD
jgi:6-pyruvoyltetrahydropterin/6-carboxytetrahydropterin synthase